MNWKPTPFAVKIPVTKKIISTMRVKTFRSVALATLLFTFYVNDANSQQSEKKEKTTFQTGGAWRPTTDTRSDVAIVYGVNDRGMPFEQRVQSWRDRGY